MRNTFLIFSFGFLLLIGCEKKDDTVTPETPKGTSSFTTANIKTKSVYFSFSANDTVAGTAQWDVKFTRLAAPDDSLKSFPIYPGIVLNNSLGVLAAFTDNADFSAFKASSAAGFKNDILDTVAVDSTAGIKVTPVYYSFDSRETTSVSGPWDIKMTINAMQEPLIILNSAKGVTGKVIDGEVFENVQAATVPDLITDTNDTTLVIGNKCLQYDPSTHLMHPYTNRTFIVRTLNGARVKFKMLDYYRSNVSGFMKFQFTAPERYAIGTALFSYNPDHSLTPYSKRVFSIKTSAGKFVKLQPLTYYKITGTTKESGYIKFDYVVE